MTAPENKQSFWTTLPGILTGVASLITAIVGLLSLFSHNLNRNKESQPVAREAYAVPAPHRVQGCEQYLGNWSWFIGGVVTMAPDGNAIWRRNRTDPFPTAIGSWSCVDSKDNKIAISWPTGYVDTLRLSTDGQSVFGSSTNGVKVSGTRLE